MGVRRSRVAEGGWRRGAATGLLGGLIWMGPGLGPHWPPLARALDVPLRLPEPAGVALTFDDGPHPEGTPAMLDALAREQVKATFFLVAEQVERFPGLTAELVAAGHEPAVHGYRHRNQMRLLPHDFHADLARAVAVIEDVCGRRPALYRPPYGVFTLPGLSAVRRAGLRPLLWSKWGRDWRAKTTPSEIARLVTRGIGGGDVILLHDADWYSHPGAHRRTAAALPAILCELDRRGLVAVRPR